MNNDAAVQGTNDHSIVSKCSTAKQGYFDDKFLESFVSKKARRSPLIHRGYHVRWAAIEKAYQDFLTHCNSSYCQIICMGCGFDSSYFRLKYNGSLSNCTYFEIDFPTLVKRKVKLIQCKTELFTLLPDDCVFNFEGDEKSILALNSSSYRIVGVDLTKTEELSKALIKAGINFSLPTLCISEVVLAYMSSSGSDRVIRWAAQSFLNASFVLFEQINPFDAFGKFMKKHFIKLGSPLKSIDSYPSKESQRNRFINLGWKYVDVHDLNEFYYEIMPEKERLKAEAIELFDEFEEWHLYCNHYIILSAFNGSCIPDHFNSSNEHITISILPHYCENRSLNIEKFVDTQTVNQNIQHNSQLCMFGHCSWLLDTHLLVCCGGFGKMNESHERLKGLNLCCMNSNVLYDYDIEENVRSIKRLYHTMTKISEDTLIMIGGRLSPNKPIEEIRKLKISISNCISSDHSTQNSATCCIDLLHKNKDCKRKVNITSESINCSGQIPAARWRHSCSLIEINGKKFLFIFGGVSLIEKASSDAFLFDIEKNEWSTVESSSDCPPPRNSHSASVINNNVYISCGLLKSIVPCGFIYKFNVVDFTWEQLNVKGRLTPRYSHSSANIKDKLFLVGGVSLNQYSPGVACIDIETFSVNEYQCKISNPDDILMLHGHSILICENELIISGGGGNCFSFGTHFNNSPYFIDLAMIE